jgi:hypothetical protein
MFRQFPHRQKANPNAEAIHTISERDFPPDCPVHKRFPSQLTKGLLSHPSPEDYGHCSFRGKVTDERSVVLSYQTPMDSTGEKSRREEVRDMQTCQRRTKPEDNTRHPNFSRNATTCCVWLAPPPSRKEIPGTKRLGTAPHRVYLVRRVR